MTAEFTWAVAGLLAAGTATLRLTGMFVAGPALARHPVLVRFASMIPVAIVAALVTQLTLTAGRSFEVDARAAGVATAGILVWRRAPFALVVLSAAFVTAAIRAL